MIGTTVIRSVEWVVGWDDDAGAHRYMKDIDVAFRGGDILHVGPNFDGPAEHEIAGAGLMVMPGLIDVHSHPLSEPMNKGYAEDIGNPALGYSGLYDYMRAYGPDEDGMRACAQAAYGELLMGGVTTLVDLSVPYDGWLDLLQASGLRGITAPMFRAAQWVNRTGHAVEWEWAEDGGEAAYAAALAVVDAALNHPSDRLSAMLSPGQIDTCPPELLAKARDAARERGVPLTIHAAQSVVEFQEMTRRHGVTPIRWMADQGLLAPDTIVAHAIFLDHHSWLRWGTRDDLRILAESGAGIAHCPGVFQRHGIVLEDFGRYRAAGIPIGIGTDSFPHSLTEEMRSAVHLARVSARRVEAARTADVFDAATITAAGLLGRDDLGRLVPGAKADLVLVDLGHPAMRPARDPLKSFLYSAADRAVRDVYVGGTRVVADGRVTTLDMASALDGVDAARARATPLVPERHWSGGSLDEVSPLSYLLVKG